MFKRNAMLSFMNLCEFSEFYQSLQLRGRWNIQTGKMNDRGKLIENKRYTNTLKKLFMEKKLFRRNVSIAEVISFLDEYVIIDRIISLLETKLESDEFDSINLYLEYKIPFSKNRRIDMVFVHGKKILVVEFRLSMDFPNQSSMWTKKETELIIYKELLSNFLDKDFKIYLYALIAMPEYHLNRVIDKNVVYNRNNIEYFVDYLITYLFNKNVRPEEFDISMR